MKSRHIAIATAFAAALLSFSLAACVETPQEPRSGASGNGSSQKPVPVRVALAEISQWPSTYEATGTVRARASVTIAAKMMAAVRDVKVRMGDHVNEGQVLVVLDSRDVDAGVRRAEAAREEIKSALPEAESAVSASKANLDLAQVTFRRMQDLFNKTSISNQEFDEAAARFKAAQAAYDMARARRAQLDSKLAQAEQEVKLAEVNRSYVELAAPFAGLVTSKSVEPGTMAMPGAALLTIEREGSYRLEASVEESRLGSIHVGQSLQISLDGIGRAFVGKVSEVVPEIDPASRTGIVKIDLPKVPELRSGLFGRAMFGGGARRAMTIPTAAVVERGQLQSVFVIENGIAHARLVTLGAMRGERVEVLSGLNQGESVAISPHGLTDGAPVEVRR